MHSENKYCDIQDGCKLLSRARADNENLCSEYNQIVNLNNSLKNTNDDLISQLHAKTEECRGLIRKLDLQEELSREYAHAACSKHGDVTDSLGKYIAKVDACKNIFADIIKIADNDCNDCVWLYEPERCIGCPTLKIKEKINEVLK